MNPDPDSPPPADPQANLEAATASLVDALQATTQLRRRIAAATDGALAEVLLQQLEHQRETVAMLLEWLRQADAALDSHLRAYLFQATDEPPPEGVTDTGLRAVVTPPAEVPVPPSAPSPVPAPVPVPAGLPGPVAAVRTTTLPLTPAHQRIRG
ncbi:MAG: hypothetical protein HY904_19560 [Deltaproteobacteria bacterium]|nr:hypothetical protein [Deltaproteobacteria bacterium]